MSTLAGGFAKTVVTDELNRPHTVHADAYGRTIAGEELLNGLPVYTDYVYDLLGRLTDLFDDANNQWTYGYDSLGRRLSADDPDLGYWTYAYDDAGRLIEQTDALGQRTALTYDAAGRVLARKARYGTAQETWTTFTYDEYRLPSWYNTGRLTQAWNAVGQMIRYNYDKDGRLVRANEVVGGADHFFDWSYGSGGRLLWRGYPDGDTVGSATTTFQYDAAGRLKAVPGLVTSILYDARGNQTNVARTNAVTTAFTYSPERGWLTDFDTTGTAGTIQDLAYTRDAMSRITGVTSPIAGESWTFGYDDLDRLTSADNATDNLLDQTFQYDSVGNMTFNSAVGTYSYPAAGFPRPHAVTATPLGSYQYDANGNMTNAAGDLLTYDGENRLTSVNGVQFVYGPDGAGLKKIDGAATTVYFGDDVELTGTQYTKYLPGDAKRVGLSTTT